MNSDACRRSCRLETSNTVKSCTDSVDWKRYKHIRECEMRNWRWSCSGVFEGRPCACLSEYLPCCSFSAAGHKSLSDRQMSTCRRSHCPLTLSGSSPCASLLYDDNLPGSSIHMTYAAIVAAVAVPRPDGKPSYLLFGAGRRSIFLRRVPSRRRRWVRTLSG